MDRSQPSLGGCQYHKHPPRTTTPSSGRVLFEERTGTGYLWWQLTISRHVKEGAWLLYAAAAAVW